MSDKNIILFGSGLKKTLEAHSISDIILSAKFNQFTLKLGVKNLLNYFDSNRFDSSSGEHLSSIDPGRRLYFNMIFGL